MMNGMLEKLAMAVTDEFWTRLDEMVEDIEALGFEVEESYDEYIVVVNPEDEDDEADVILYLGHANTTIWVERIREM